MANRDGFRGENEPAGAASPYVNQRGIQHNGGEGGKSPDTPRLYLQDPDVELHLGDALEVLQGLPDESVHCVATSPPFFGLRDYGTGRWEGGDEGCDHSRQSAVSRESSTLGGATTTQGGAYAWGDACGKCGARRVDQQIGLESSPDEWASRLVAVFREARRVLRADGSLWVECGDSYGANQGKGFNSVAFRGEGHVNQKRLGQETPITHPYKPKDLIGQPFLLAFALRADGWYWRGVNIWAKPNAMPESAKDRCTVAHSYVLHFSKSARYFFDADAIREPFTTDPENGGGWSQSYRDEQRKVHSGGNDFGRTYNPAGPNPRSVWTIPTQGFPEAHFATWPEALARRIILAAVPEQVCSVCGKARERITEVEVVTVQATNSDNPQDPAGRRRPQKTVPMKGNYRASTHTLGFTDCGHDAYRPGVVLDPFAGSGTTCYVARKHNRRAIGIDLNEEYLEMAARRLQQQSLFADGVT